MAAKTSPQTFGPAHWDLYTVGIVASGVIGIGLIAYSLVFGSAHEKQPVQRSVQLPAAAAVSAAAAPAAAPITVAMAPKPEQVKAVAAPSAAEQAQKMAAFDKFFVPPAGCSSPPQAKESPDCGVRYGHARMEFERQWALGQLR
ncbi:MAG: hypothetical protein ACRCV9_19945 [Burkholderiaceae bacterium]